MNPWDQAAPGLGRLQADTAVESDTFSPGARRGLDGALTVLIAWAAVARPVGTCVCACSAGGAAAWLAVVAWLAWVLQP